MEKKHFDFIEVGTSDFHTLIEEATDSTIGLCVEPLDYQLNNLPNKKNVVKLNAALSNKIGTVNLYYIDDEKIYENNLPFWVRGCNSVNKPHEFTKKKIGADLYDEIVSIKKVPTVTWEKIISDYGIGSIDFLKIDTEGHEHIILEDYFNICQNNPELFANEILFEYNETSNKEKLDELIYIIKSTYDVTYDDADVKLKKKSSNLRKAFVYYATENYFDIVEASVKSVRLVSDLPIYVYFLNSNKTLNIPNVTTINWFCNLRETADKMYIEDNDNYYINRSNERIYDILIQRPLIVKDCLENYAEVVCYIDSDSVATNQINNIFDYYDENSKYPYFVRGIYDYLFWKGKGGNELDKTLEKPACDLLDINQNVRKLYRQTGYFISGKKTIDFLDEWYWMCNHPKIKNNVEHFAPYNEETIANILLWKYNYQNGLPLVYINGGLTAIEETNHLVSLNIFDIEIREWFRMPEKKEHIMFYHGEKNPKNILDMCKVLNPNSEIKSGVYYKNIKIADVCYVINLPERTDRRENVTKILNELHITGYEFIDGVRFREEEYKKLGCTATYLEIFKRILNSNHDNVLVIEDDIKLMNNVTENDLDEIFNNWSETINSYDVVALGTKLLPRTKIIQQGKTHGYFEEMLCTQSLLYTRKFISHYITLMENYLDKSHFLYKCTVDMFLNDCSCEKYRFIHSEHHKKFNFGITIPMIFTQTDSVSDNENTPQIYDSIMEESFWRSLEAGKAITPRINAEQINLLFLAPHLSTGGMPAFLLKRIETILEHHKNINIFVVEFSDFSPVYVVQKNKIKSLIPSNNFFTLGENKNELIDIIKNNKIDIVHVEEIVEGFESFNQIPKETLEALYTPDRTWRMVETCHNVWFDPNTLKRFNPDAYAFCTPYHQEKTFSQMDSYSELLEFPIENNSRTQFDKLNAQQILGLDPTKKHIINVGLWTHGKNQKEGVEVARLMETSNPEIQFHFIGNQAPNFQDYWKPVMENLPSNVMVWGERNDIDIFMKAADLFMFNSTWECNPIVIREAISYGLNIICRNLPQYLNMFSKYINPIDDNIEKTKSLILKIIDSQPVYDIPENQTQVFAEKHNNLYKKLMSNPPRKSVKIKPKVDVTQYFIKQPFLEIKGNNQEIYDIRFFDENGNLAYQNMLPVNHWVRLNKQYYTKWRTEIRLDGDVVYENTLDYAGKRVYIAFDSSSLGDTIAWIPYCLEFKKKHNCHVIVSTFWNKLFQKVYPELEFVAPGTNVSNLLGMYLLGWFYNPDMEPELCNTIPLQKAATNILGLEYTEIQPRIHFDIKKKPYEGKYVTIATNSTAGCKFWTREGWQNVIDYLHGLGYKIINVSKEDNPFKNVQKIKDTSIENTMNVIHHSEFFIGLSSGLSWLAWGLGKHVVMISNFTEADHEFTTNCTRMTKTDVCHGCWNNPDIRFDKGDWNWCPFHKGTNRQFECHTTITPLMVINSIEHLLK